MRTTTAGIVDLSEDQLKSISEKSIDEYVVAGEKLRDLKKRLNTLAQKISTTSGKPLIIIIDELDRCRPVFAIELLEKIKHLFDIPGILFILGIDREQLGNSVKSIYGQHMNVDGYLRRFIDMEFLLPPANAQVYCLHLFEQFGLNGYFEKRSTNGLDEKAILQNLFAKLCASFKLSLRDIEHCFRMLAMACFNTHESKHLYPDLLSFLIILKLTDSKLYYAFIAGQCNGVKVIDFMSKQDVGENLLKTREGGLLEAQIYLVSPKAWRENAFKQMKLKSENKEFKRECLSERLIQLTGDDFENLYCP